MCTKSCLEFSARQLSLEELKNKKILEVGSRDVNGGLRLFIEKWAKPLEYIGVDIEDGPGVDSICDVNDLVTHFGKERFDLVISTELLEHVRDWKQAISNIKNVCKKGGLIVVTTRSRGFRPHAYPYDFWRYEINDMREIFSDCEIIALESDQYSPGVFVKVKIPYEFEENDLQDIDLYNIMLNKRIKEVFRSFHPGLNYRRMQFESSIWRSVRQTIKLIAKKLS